MHEIRVSAKDDIPRRSHQPRHKEKVIFIMETSLQKRVCY